MPNEKTAGDLPCEEHRLRFYMDSQDEPDESTLRRFLDYKT